MKAIYYYMKSTTARDLIAYLLLSCLPLPKKETTHNIDILHFNRLPNKMTWTTETGHFFIDPSDS